MSCHELIYPHLALTPPPPSSPKKPVFFSLMDDVTTPGEELPVHQNNNDKVIKLFLIFF